MDLNPLSMGDLYQPNWVLEVVILLGISRRCNFTTNKTIAFRAIMTPNINTTIPSIIVAFSIVGFIIAKTIGNKSDIITTYSGLKRIHDCVQNILSLGIFRISKIIQIFELGLSWKTASSKRICGKSCVRNYQRP